MASRALHILCAKQKKKTERVVDYDDDDDDCGIMALFTGISRRSDTVLTKKAIILKGEMVHWGSGLISAKDREGRLQTTDTVWLRHPKTAIITHTGGDRCH